MTKAASADEARAAYQAAVDSQDFVSAGRAALALGVLLRKEGDLEGAIAAFRLAIDSSNAETVCTAANSLGTLLKGQGDVEGAKAAYQLAIDSDAGRGWMAAFNLWYLLKEHGDVEGAKAAYQLAIDSDAGRAANMAFQLGVHLQKRGDVEGAKRAYQFAIDSHHAEHAPKAAFNLELLASGKNRFGPNERAVMQLIRQAAMMDFDQLSCADTILNEMNGPTGLSKPWRDAQLGLSRIKSFRQGPADRASSAGAEAVMTAVATIANDQESSAAILANWDLCKNDKITLFRGFIRAPRAQRVLRGHLVERFGRKGAEVVDGARWAVSMSAEVLVVWDLASVNGPFTVAHRDFLMKPWLSVFDLPDGL